MLLEAILTVGSDLDLPGTLQQIVTTAAALTDARYGALGVLDQERGRITELYSTGMTAQERERIGHLPEAREGVLGVLLRDAQPLVVKDLATDPRSGGMPPGHPPMRTFVGVPVLVQDEVFGNLYLAEKRHGHFTTTDLALLRSLGTKAGIAIGNARLYGTVRRRERWIEGAAAVTTALLSGTDAGEALLTVAERARVLADAVAGVILQPTEAGGMKIVAASSPDDPDGIVGAVIEPGTPVLEQLLRGEPVFIEDSATDPRMTTPVRSRFGPSMMLPLHDDGRLLGTLALPRRRGDRPYTSADRLLATQFTAHAALALVMAGAQHDREQLAVYEDRDRIARDLHDLVVQRLFATEMLLESARRRSGPGAAHDLLGRAVDELDSTIQEVRTAIFTLQQPPAEAPATLRGLVLRETAGAGAVLGFQPSVHFTGAVDALVREEDRQPLLAALRRALAAAHRRPGVSAIEVEVDVTSKLADGRAAVRLMVADDGTEEDGTPSATVTWQAAL
ncbi:GAF domain-containing protein [uncultured Streptomyces sp.]|uniref:GAF domain-containing protein n=1 Tax=uncultured Streptomyces sp. TaxID=174707 RepID=UPI002609E855|nr:GAF domain-containing protein [uncultured Streptomyces sp.]